MLIEQPSSFLRWMYPKALWRMDEGTRTVYLTFDDGPIPESTPFILETLKAFCVKATFFVVGENAARYPELMQAIVADGHQIGNHTYNHLGSFRHWSSTYWVNTFRAQQVIDRYIPIGEERPLFRPPHGWMRPTSYYWLSKVFRVVMWDVVTRDYSRYMTADDVVENVRKYTRNGSIITFHDSLKSIDKLHYALPETLSWLKAEGLECGIL